MNSNTILFVVLLFACVGCDFAVPQTDSPPSESTMAPSSTATVNPEERLQGEWIAVRGEAKGNPTVLEGYSYSFSDGEFTAVAPHHTANGTYEVDATETPMHIMFENHGVGIFRFFGDELHLCIDRDVRPTEFAASPDSYEILTICVRPK